MLVERVDPGPQELPHRRGRTRCGDALRGFFGRSASGSGSARLRARRSGGLGLGAARPRAPAARLRSASASARLGLGFGLGRRPRARRPASSSASTSSSVGSPARSPRRRVSCSPRSSASIAASSSSLGSSPPSGHDVRLHRRVHVLEELDRDVVAADPLDRVDLDLAPVDADLLRAPELVGDVRRRHRAEERARRPGLHLEAEHRLREHSGDLVRLVDRPRLVPRALLLALAELRDLRGRRGLGEPARQEEVPRVAARDVHDLAAEAELVDVVEEDDFHRANR